MPSDQLFRFHFQKPEWLNSSTARSASVYLAGAIFSIGFFIFIDAASFSASARNGSDFHITFVDWIPIIFSVLGMLIVNSIDKSRLAGDSSGFAYSSYSGDGLAWKARVVLFMGFAATAGGLAGGVCMLVLKYIVPVASTTGATLWLGVANVVSTFLISLSSVVLWVGLNMEEDYVYSLTL